MCPEVGVWTKILPNGVVELRIPATLRLVPQRSPDSAVAVWESDVLSIVVDTGPFADRLEGPRNCGTVGDERLGGAMVRIATFAEQDDGTHSWGENNNDVLNPGEGVFIFSAAARSITFVGEVPLGTALNNNIDAGFNLKSSIVPQAGQIDTVLKYPPVAGDAVYLLKPDGSGYNISTYEEQDDGSFNWNVPPVLTVGEGVWILSATAKTWTRSFTMADTN
jgi:hypothetical protein